jgi:hypothetical protein
VLDEFLQTLQQSLSSTTGYNSSGEANNMIAALVVNYQS